MLFHNFRLVFSLPQRDHLGRKIIFYRASSIDPSKNTSIDLLRVLGVVLESLLEEEETQINGVVHVIDLSGVGFRHAAFWPPKESYRLGKNIEVREIIMQTVINNHSHFQKNFPMRHKEIHVLKVHPTLKFIFDFVLSQASEKIRKRFRFHEKSEDVKKVIDLKILPAEYGGVMPISEMIATFKKDLEAQHKLILSHDLMTVKSELYPQSVCQGSVRSLKRTIEDCVDTFHSSGTNFGVQGSFRNLEID